MANALASDLQERSSGRNSFGFEIMKIFMESFQAKTLKLKFVSKKFLNFIYRPNITRSLAGCLPGFESYRISSSSARASLA